MSFEVSGNLRVTIYNFIQYKYGEVNDITIKKFSDECHLPFQNTKNFIFFQNLDELNLKDYNEVVDKTTEYIFLFLRKNWSRYKSYCFDELENNE